MSANPKAVRTGLDASKPATATDSTPASSVPSVPFDPTKAKILRYVTVPLHKLRAGDEIWCKIAKPIEQAREMKNQKPGDDKKTPPHLLQIVNLVTGEVEQIIVGATLLDEFKENYPSDSYVGKGFHIKVGEQKAAQGGGGKRYNTYAVTEIELPA